MSLAERDNPLRVIVLIDDLDRAGPAEIRAMLKVVKLIADLPNISYVLSMDDRRVREVLGESASESYGAEFLDKIVQASIRLPPIPADKMRALVIKSINAELAEVEAPLLEDDDPTMGFNGALDYNATIGKRVRTLRDRARFVNALRFALRTGDRKLDVHPPDIVLLSFLQTFYPEVYERIWRHKAFLTVSDLSFADLMLKDQDKPAKAKRRQIQFRQIAGASIEESILGGVTVPSEADVPLRVLSDLFPSAETGQELSEADARQFRLSNRIGIADRFDRYFQLSPPPDEVEDQEIALVLQALQEIVNKSSGDRVAETRTLLTPYGVQAHDAKRASFFEKVRDRIGLMPPLDLPKIGRQLVDVAETIGSRETSGVVDEIVRALYRTAVFQSDTRGTREREAAELVAYEIDNIPDAQTAIGLANDYARRAVGAARFEDGLIPSIARAGLRRAEAFFANDLDVFASLGVSQAVELLWDWERLDKAVNRNPSGVRTYTTSLLKRRPDSLSEVISMAAGWTETPSLASRPKKEIWDALNGATDLETVLAMTRDPKRTTGGKYPDLIDQLTALVGGADEAKTTNGDE